MSKYSYTPGAVIFVCSLFAGGVFVALALMGEIL